MRLRNLLLVAAFVSSVCLAGLAQTKVDATDLVSNNTAASVPDQAQNARLPLRRTLNLPENDRVCLKLRTYVVRRVDPVSDVTRLHSYSTCQPAWKFETRSAVQHESSPSDRPLSY